MTRCTLKVFGLSTYLVATAMGLACSASASSPVDDDLRIFIDMHRCAIIERLEMIQMEPRVGPDPKNRYLIVSPVQHIGNYAQCIFFEDDSKMYCEAASGFFLTKPGQPNPTWLSPESRAAVVSLGYSLDDSKGNFAQKITLSTETSLSSIAELLLTTLHRVYSARSYMRLELKAPLAPRPRVVSPCRPTS